MYLLPTEQWKTCALFMSSLIYSRVSVVCAFAIVMHKQKECICYYIRIFNFWFLFKLLNWCKRSTSSTRSVVVVNSRKINGKVDFCNVMLDKILLLWLFYLFNFIAHSEETCAIMPVTLRDLVPVLKLTLNDDHCTLKDDSCTKTGFSGRFLYKIGTKTDSNERFLY